MQNYIRRLISAMVLRRSRFYEPFIYKTEKIVQTCPRKTPAHMGQAGPAYRDLPEISVKPSELIARCADSSASRCIWKTADLENNAVGIGERVIVCPIYDDPIWRIGDGK